MQKVNWKVKTKGIESYLATMPATLESFSLNKIKNQTIKMPLRAKTFKSGQE